MEPATAPAYTLLRHNVEDQWLPQMMRLLGLDAHSLPVIWDADFLYGPRDADGADSYVLCEINASSCFAIPDEAPAAIARTVMSRECGCITHPRHDTHRRPGEGRDP